MATAEDQHQLVNPDHPLYVRVPWEIHEYLDEIKKEKGINKNDSVTILLEIALKYIPIDMIEELWNEYMILGREGIKLSSIQERLVNRNDRHNRPPDD